MKNVQKPLLAITAFLLCVNWSMDQDEHSLSGGGKKPAFNFIGTVHDNTGKPFKASYITISGLYKQIPVYSKPEDMNNSNYNPSENVTRLDLAEISKIEVPHPEDVSTFKDRKYTIINVYSKDVSKTKNSYLIDSNKRILCNQINAAGPTEKEISFPAIHSIVITGHKKVVEKQPTTPVHVAQHAKTHPTVHPAALPKNSAPAPTPAHAHVAQHAKIHPTAHPAALPKNSAPATTPIPAMPPHAQPKHTVHPAALPKNSAPAPTPAMPTPAHAQPNPLHLNPVMTPHAQTKHTAHTANMPPVSMPTPIAHPTKQ